MNNMFVFDLEANGLNANKIHCLAACDLSTGKIKKTTSYKNMRDFFSDPSRVLIAHNGIRYDKPTAERILGIEIKCEMVDTLALSYYLETDRTVHGLEAWGEFFGIPKPVITDWESLSTEEYLHRVTEDVRINTKLWKKFWDSLMRLYGDEAEAWRLIRYLSFKFTCAAAQEALKWKLDIPKCEQGLAMLTEEHTNKTEQLREAMPPVVKTAMKAKPAKMYTKKGDLSAVGQKWLDLLESKGLPEDHDEPVEAVVSYKEPNPGSVPQLKDWLFSLGWEPTTFKYVRDKTTNEFRTIPQIADKEEDDGVCASVKLLFDREPKLEVLEGLTVLKHRMGILKGFLENVDDQGYVTAGIQGLTNTLRFRHKVFVNLPGIDKPYGDLIRGCLSSCDGYELCGSDMSGLEDRTKKHYMWDYDPQYVKDMDTPGFDSHLDIGLTAKMVTQEEVDAYKAGDKEVKARLGPIRHAAKQINYSCVYGVTPAGIVRNTGMPLKQAEKMHKTFWDRNWAVKAVADNCTTKKCNGGTWLYNPVSRFWYSLRSDKDRFSTLNQGTGVYAFDTWVRNMVKLGLTPIGQMHDEVILHIPLGTREEVEYKLKLAMSKTNAALKLNMPLDCSIAFGKDYSHIH